MEVQSYTQYLTQSFFEQQTDYQKDSSIFSKNQPQLIDLLSNITQQNKQPLYNLQPIPFNQLPSHEPSIKYFSDKQDDQLSSSLSLFNLSSTQILSQQIARDSLQNPQTIQRQLSGETLTQDFIKKGIQVKNKKNSLDIQVTCSESQRTKVIKGKSDETKQLGKHFSQRMIQCLGDYSDQNKFIQQDQRQDIEQFIKNTKKDKGSQVKLFQKLVVNKNEQGQNKRKGLQDYLYQKIRGGNFIRSFLKGDMQYRRKIVAIKYMKKFEDLPYCPETRKWKNGQA